MYRVILVDDDPQYRSMLKHTIRWDILGLKLAGEYGRGEDALRALPEANADIVITDMRLSDMDGLAMIRQIREFSPDCRIVIVSEHRDFGYLQAAIRLAVSDYLPKPVDGEEINAALRTLSEAMAHEKQVGEAHLRRKKLVSVLRGQRWMHSVEQTNRDYGTHFSQSGRFMVLCVAVCRATESSSATELAESVVQQMKQALAPLCTEMEAFMLSRLRYAMLLQVEPENLERFYKTADEAYLALTRRIPRPEGERFFCSVGRAVAGIREIRVSMESAHFYINGRFTHGETGVFFADIAEKPEIWEKEIGKLPREAMRKLETAVEHADEPAIRACIREVFDSYRGEDNPTLCIYLCRSICALLTGKLGQLGISGAQTRAITEDVDNRVDNCDTYDMLRETMERLCLEAVRAFLAERQQNPKSYVQIAKSWLDMHFAENVTLSVLAEQAHVNAAYLSALFKEEMGVNYTEYLTNLRVEHAKKLLTDASMNISDIAQRVGYNSMRYFSKLFESQTGIKPAEYRRLYLRHEKR